jgi:hypothetical protein
MALTMRSANRDETGRSPRDLTELVIALFRRGKVVALTDPDGHTIQTRMVMKTGGSTWNRSGRTVCSVSSERRRDA